MTTPGVTPGAKEENYAPGDTVWVKLDRWPWWPARVVPQDECKELVRPNRPVAACIQFPIEDNYDVIYDKAKLRPWTDANNVELIKKTWGQVKAKPLHVQKLLKDVLLQLEKEYHVNVPQIPEGSSKPASESKPDWSQPRTPSQPAITSSRGADSVTSEPRPPKSEMAKCLSLLPKNLSSSPEGGHDSISGDQGGFVSFKPSEGCPKLGEDLLTLNGNARQGHGILGDAAQNGSIEGRSMDWSVTDWLLSDQRRRSLGDEAKQDVGKEETRKAITPPTNHSRLKRAHTSPADQSRGTRPKRRLEDTFPARSNSLQWDPNIDEDSCDVPTTRPAPDRCESPALVPLPLSQPEPTSTGETEDTSMSDDDSDDDLPDVLSSATKDPIKKGTLLWVQYRRYPFWPAIVRNCYLRKKTLQKVSFVFIGDGIYSCEAKGRPLTMKYNRKKMVPFAGDMEKHAQFKEDGLGSPFSVLFKEAITRVEDFLVKKCLNVTDCPFTFFAEDLLTEKWSTQHGTQEDDMTSCSDMADSEARTVENSETHENPDDEPGLENLDAGSNSEDEGEGDEDCEVTGEEVSKQILNIKARRQKTGERLLGIIKSDRIKNYLLDIYHERRPCDRHKAFKAEESRKTLSSISTHGFGAIDDEEQQMQLIQLLGQYYHLASGDPLPNMTYIFHVWLPEAMIEATHRVLKKTRAFAEERYLKGPFRLKKEKQLEHAAMIECGKNIAPEDAERYRRKLELLKAHMNLDGAGFVPSPGPVCT